MRAHRRLCGDLGSLLLLASLLLLGLSLGLGMSDTKSLAERRGFLRGGGGCGVVSRYLRAVD